VKGERTVVAGESGWLWISNELMCLLGRKLGSYRLRRRLDIVSGALKVVGVLHGVQRQQVREAVIEVAGSRDDVAAAIVAGGAGRERVGCQDHWGGLNLQTSPNSNEWLA
jgi:hypothetical protein